MKNKNNYKISFTGLSLGKHNFEFSLDKLFFEEFGANELINAKININVALEKQSTFLQLDCNYKGSIELTCDRCGDLMEMNIDQLSKLIFKLNGESYKELDDEVILLSDKDYEVDLKQYFYEITYLSLPLRRTHANEGECNKEAIKKLKEISVPEIKPDPRWEQLKKLNNNN